MLGLNDLAKRFFGSENDRRVKAARSTVDRINGLEAEIEKRTDEELQAETVRFRERLAAGEALDKLLPEAFATVREASRRTLGMRHFDVQLIGGMMLHQGKIAEMKTGEGKTLMATLPVYLNALTGGGVHVVTVNDYLAKRDAEWMGQVYRFLGLTVGIVVPGMADQARKAAYGCDVTYATNNELGFDYLRDNMKYQLDAMVQRGHRYAIVDEVDSILVDEARTPLIISGPTQDMSELYVAIDKVIPKLDEEHYEIDEKRKTVTLTEDGTEHVEQTLHDMEMLPADASLYDPDSVSLVHHVNQALRAHKLFTRDKDYIVRKGSVIIIDEFTGRMMEGRRYSEGLHQALEAKESAQIQPENVTLASVTFQNYFRLYDKLAGMTGTAMTEAGEFGEIYGLEVVEIPPNLPVVRDDEDDQVFRTTKEKYDAIVEAIKDGQTRGQPILVGTASIERSEYLAGILKNEGVAHRVLNARYHEREAYIVAQAGRPGAVTIATNMAGRGTDIQLGGNADMAVAEKIGGDVCLEIDALVGELSPSDYQLEPQTKMAMLTEDGAKTVEVKLRERGLLPEDMAIENPESGVLVHHVMQALRARLLFKPKVDFIVRDDDVYLSPAAIDAMPSARRLLDGLNQAIAARVGAAIVPETITQALVGFLERTNPERVTEVRDAVGASVGEAKRTALDAGGLWVIGTERHESRRIDNQLRGRSGRQGDPGRSTFFLSLEDDLMRIFGSQKMDGMLRSLGLEEGEAIVHRWVNKAIERAQGKVEAQNFEMRKNVLKYDDVMNDQRRAIFEQRRELMEADDIQDTIRDMRHQVVDDLVAQYIPERAYAEQWETDKLEAAVTEIFGQALPVQEWADEEGADDETLRERLHAETDKLAAKKATDVGTDNMRKIEKGLVLQTVDERWREHIASLDHLRSVIGFRGYAQRDPLNEYKSEAFTLFETLLARLRTDVVTQLMAVKVAQPEAPTATPAELRPSNISVTLGSATIREPEAQPQPAQPHAAAQPQATRETATAAASADAAPADAAPQTADADAPQQPGKGAGQGKNRSRGKSKGSRRGRSRR